MNLKRIAITLSAAALSMSAFAANAAYIGDENDLSWLPGRQATQEQSSTAGASTAPASTDSKQFVNIGDENNLDWLPTPAKR